MKMWTGILATAAACAAQPAGAAATPRSLAESPSDEDVERAYETFLERSMCGGGARCDEARVDDLSQVECAPGRRSRPIRCRFALHVETPLPDRGHTGLGMDVHLHLCSGWFQKRRRGWRMVSLIGLCPPFPTQTPAR